MLKRTLLLSLVMLAPMIARADSPAADDAEIDPAERGVGLFVFKIPKGWQDKSTSLITVAVDDKHKLVFQAKVVKGGDEPDEAMLDKFVSDAERSLRKLVPTARLDVKKKSLVKLGRLSAARFLFDMITQEGQPPVRALEFSVAAPAIDQHAILTFTGPPAEFDRRLKLFDKIAAATQVKKQ